MSMDSTATIYARLTAVPAIVAALDTWNGLPAIFNDRAPDEFVFSEKAALIIGAPTTDDDASTLTETVRLIVQPIRIYAKDEGSSDELDRLGRHVRDAFHLQAASLVVDGGKATTATATGPVEAPTTDPSLIGRRVSVRLELQET